MRGNRLGRVRWLFLIVGMLALGLVGSAGAVPGRASAASTIKITYLGPSSLGAGQSAVLHAVNTDSQSHTADLRIKDDLGNVVFRLGVNIPANGSRVARCAYPLCGGYWFAQIASRSSMVTGSLEIIDDTTGAPTALLEPNSLLGGSAGLGVGGPVAMSDELTELAVFTNVTSANRMVTITFYDSGGTVLDQATQTVGARRTASRNFATTVEGEAVHYTLSVSGTTPAIIGATVGLTPAGLTAWTSPIWYEP